MGFRVSWIARQGTSKKELIAASGGALTGERHDFPDIGFYLLELCPKGMNPWVLLIADGTEFFAALTPELARSLSETGNEILYFWCSDTTMATELCCFKVGSEAWAIRYDCGNKEKRPLVEGPVPEIALDILAERRREQANNTGADHIYDLTAELGQRLVGFRHGHGADTEDPEPFQVLERASGAKHPWWKFWKR